MATNLSIGLYLPSKIIPSDILDINQLGFITASQHCYSQKIAEFYPSINLPIRSYLVGESQFKDERVFRKRMADRSIRLSHNRIKRKEQIVFNELFKIDGNLKNGIDEQKIITYLELILKQSSDVEIIFNEMNTYRITHYTGNGIQDNGVLRLLQKVQEKFPGANLSLGVQTIGNKLCKDLILKSLPFVLSHIKNLDWFNWPIHFTEVGYYHDPFSPQQQTKFLNEIKRIAIENNVSSLCYIYPWDGDYFHLAGQPRNTLCGIWGDDWSIKYNIF
jgi:hypothetical protein